MATSDYEYFLNMFNELEKDHLSHPAVILERRWCEGWSTDALRCAQKLNNITWVDLTTYCSMEFVKSYARACNLPFPEGVYD